MHRIPATDLLSHAFVRSLGITLGIAGGLLVVLGLPALMVLPRLAGAGQTAREAALKGELHQFRNAIAQFEVDMGDFPARLSDLTAAAAPVGRGGRGRKLTSSGFQGPYVRTPDGGVPIDPFTRSNKTWAYSPATGEIRSGAPGKARSGEPLGSW